MDLDQGELVLPAGYNISYRAIKADHEAVSLVLSALGPVAHARRLAPRRYEWDFSAPMVVCEDLDGDRRWSFRFFRQHGGFRFRDEALRVEIAERSRGLLAYMCHASDQVVPEPRVALGRDDARNRVVEMLKGPSGLAQFLDEQGATYAEATLSVDEAPRFVHMNEAYPGFPTRSPDLPLRLAYICTVEARTSEDPLRYTKYELEVWVDAATGALVGGDYTVYVVDKTLRPRSTTAPTAVDAEAGGADTQ